jgi:hypothetical protein
MQGKQAADLINSYGMTQLEYLGNNHYRYRFISFVYEEFLPDKQNR